MTSVLVVEDEPQLVRALEINLRARQYEVAAAPDGATALRLAIDGSPDIVLMDLGLPDIDGIEVIRRLRSWSRVPIVVVSARRTSEEKVEALDAGADDYLTKPFSMAELVARLRAAARRVEPAAPADDICLIATEDFTVDLLGKRVRRRGSDVRLTATEWQLLEVLVRRRGRTIGQEELLKEVWGDSFTTRSNQLRVHMARLRRKLEGDPVHPRHFITFPGVGYRFEV
ncbi:response regulator [Streptomyces albipurpureus]|uniref:Response regulator transcription factor n=1 Tax=Streptomyces albipurpureus TaxID=2897419 RepID=A0ABT0UG20_9ACTN|nr:response regulator transcription factor [Streptomyces sp. CWNU-1]MCM2387211.1 response regulator transcription factor [Streptomyces sp. CWNU-1]